MLTVENSALLVVDVQEKLMRNIHQREKLVDNLQKLIKGIQVLGIPILMSEQYPKGLGATIPEIAQLTPDIQPVPKLSFSCLGDENFLKKLEMLGKKQVLVSGIETHVCVYQTVRDLISSGYEVYAVTDTICSRTVGDKEIGLNLICRMGAVLTSTETVLFELLRIAGGEKFKAISQIVK